MNQSYAFYEFYRKLNDHTMARAFLRKLVKENSGLIDDIQSVEYMHPDDVITLSKRMYPLYLLVKLPPANGWVH